MDTANATASSGGGWAEEPASAIAEKVEEPPTPVKEPVTGRVPLANGIKTAKATPAVPRTKAAPAVRSWAQIARYEYQVCFVEILI